MNKKGLSYFIMFLVYLIVLSMVLYFIVQIAKQGLAADLETKGLEYDLLMNRLLYSPNSISYTDTTIGRTYPGIIDMNKFNEETLNKTFGDSKRFGMKVNLGKDTIYYNKESYDEFQPLLWSEKYGSLNQTMFVFTDTNKKQGEMLHVLMVYAK